MSYDTGGNYIPQLTTHCIYCNKKLELTSEYNLCTECQIKKLNKKEGTEL